MSSSMNRKFSLYVKQNVGKGIFTPEFAMAHAIGWLLETRKVAARRGNKKLELAAKAMLTAADLSLK